MQKTTIEIPLSRFIQLESNVQEILETIKEPNEPSKNEVFTSKQFCEYFGISLATFHRMKNDGRVQTFTIGKRIFIKKEEIERLKSQGFKGRG